MVNVMTKIKRLVHLQLRSCFCKQKRCRCNLRLHLPRERVIEEIKLRTRKREIQLTKNAASLDFTSFRIVYQRNMVIPRCIVQNFFKVPVMPAALGFDLKELENWIVRGRITGDDPFVRDSRDRICRTVYPERL